MNFIKLPIMCVVWLVQLFTSAKSFIANPIIGNQLLNKLGLHVIRVLLSHAIFNVKLIILSPFVDKVDREHFKKFGYIQKTDFLSADEFERLEAEVRNYQAEFWQNVQGDTVTKRVFLTYRNLKSLPQCQSLISNPEYTRYLKYASGKNELPRFYIQQINNQSVTSDKADPQKTFHMDTFHPTMKAWLFLEDVSFDNGPFTYVPGSNRLTWSRLKWLYQQSVLGKDLENVYSRKGSMRIQQNQLKDLGFESPVAFQVPKNTLIVGNTFGFHCRGAVNQANATRLEIWAISRINPFNPMPGLNIKCLSNLRDFAYTQFEEYENRKAKQANKTATWSKLDAINLKKH